jgi:hypothetical protein
VGKKNKSQIDNNSPLHYGSRKITEIYVIIMVFPPHGDETRANQRRVWLSCGYKVL